MNNNNNKVIKESVCKDVSWIELAVMVRQRDFVNSNFRSEGLLRCDAV